MPNAKPLFIDRDGVINKSVRLPDYLTRAEQFEFLPGTFEAMQKLRDAGYDFYVITNQAGIARGQATMDEVQVIHEYMRTEFEKNGIVIEGVYVCPHDDHDDCPCRKPKPGLLLQAMQDQALKPQEVVFVGDRETDMEAAQAAGVRGLLIPGEVGLSAALPVLLS
jgi:D-glycero-D-manno-heptose 1,7-bisphosphate phosphatase